MKTIDSSTLHKNIMGSSQENLQENDTGANSMPTPSPQGAHKGNIVQSSPDEFSASQVDTNIKNEIVISLLKSVHLSLGRAIDLLEYHLNPK